MRIESKANVLVDESKEVGRKVDVVNSNLEDLNTNIISTSQERAREFTELNDLLARIEMTQKTIVALATTRGSFFQEHKTTELPVMRVSDQSLILGLSLYSRRNTASKTTSLTTGASIMLLSKANRLVPEYLFSWLAPHF